MSSDAKLRFTTLAVQRDLSEHVELAPVALPNVISYGSEDRCAPELALALSELPSESRPATVARLLLPDGVRLEQIEVEVARGELPGRLGRAFPITLTVAVVPEPRFAGTGSGVARSNAGQPSDSAPAGHWVFVPVLGHALFVSRKDDIARRLAAELAVLPAALALDLDGWRRMITHAPARLVEVDVELATTPLAEARGKKSLAEAERRRLAVLTLDGAGRRYTPPDPPNPVVGRGVLVADLGRALDHPSRRSVLLVGDEAVGKSAIVAAWAQAYRQRAVYATSVSELIAGASGLGQWQARVAAVLAAAETLDAILYFDDFGALFVDRPAEGGIDIAAAIRQHVVDGRVRIVGELTAVALDRAERRDVSLIGAMQRLAVAPTDVATTTQALHAWAQHWARTQPHRPQVSAETVPTAVDLARRYLPYRAFPGKAVRLLEELRVAHDNTRDASGAGPVLRDQELFAAFSWSTGIPLALLDDGKPLARTDVIAALRKRMIGQDAAVARVADAVCVAKARLQPADKPLASLLFVGPSGVGKTELARSVAAYLFGTPDRMVRLDMSEYTDPWAAERLFGGAGGDGGNAGEGRLTAAVRSQPFGVVLLDEIEKAHASVFDLLLQVLGEARLTDGRGRTTYFHNAIIVLTSNLGTRGARGALGLVRSETDDERETRRYRDAVLGAFRPELINRLDQIVVFQPLRPDEISRVADIAIARLAERRGLTQSGVLLDVSAPAIAALADGGFSAELGARALRRYLDAELIAPAARLLAKAGGDGHGGTLTVRARDEPVARGEPAGERAIKPNVARPVAARLGAIDGAVTVALWRRAAATGRRLVRGALALGTLRRETDRELDLPWAKTARDRLGELEGTIAKAARKKDGKTALPGKEISRLSAEHARIAERLAACQGGQAELRTAEELCLEALSRDIDAVDLIDGAVATRNRFRRDLMWLMCARRPVRPGITMLVHSPDARVAVNAWTQLAVAAAAARGWRATIHLHVSHDPGGSGTVWGPGRDRAWAADHLQRVAPPALLVRIHGTGADVLFGLEAGLHRFVGLAGEPCHLWVNLLEPRAEFEDAEWAMLPGPPIPVAPHGIVLRAAKLDDDAVDVLGEEVEVPWRELPARLEEAAIVRLIRAQYSRELAEALWAFESPIANAATSAKKT